MAKQSKKRFQIKIKSASIGTQHPEINKAQNYLTRYGYLATTTSPGALDEPTSAALKIFQEVHGLKPTGKLNAATVAALEAPRCGNSAARLIARLQEGGSANFALSGCHYNKTHFAYQLVNGTNGLPFSLVRKAVGNAFNTWASRLCSVTFTERWWVWRTLRWAFSQVTTSTGQLMLKTVSHENILHKKELKCLRIYKLRTQLAQQPSL